MPEAEQQEEKASMEALGEATANAAMLCLALTVIAVLIGASFAVAVASYDVVSSWLR